MAFSLSFSSRHASLQQVDGRRSNRQRESNQADRSAQLPNKHVVLSLAFGCRRLHTKSSRIQPAPDTTHAWLNCSVAGVMRVGRFERPSQGSSDSRYQAQRWQTPLAEPVQKNVLCTNVDRLDSLEIFRLELPKKPHQHEASGWFVPGRCAWARLTDCGFPASLLCKQDRGALNDSRD